MKILVTGGAGFIGSALIRHLLKTGEHRVLNVDKLTYAANLKALEPASQDPRYQFEQIDIVDANAIKQIFASYQPDAIMHLAAESHVDRSIHEASSFIQTNIVGTYVLLEAARAYWQALGDAKKQSFRFHHISTDEVYGELEKGDPAFVETTAYAPNSPYSASKASSDHLVRAWHRTYGLPILITNCSNNYGPFQYPEKLIPLMIHNALAGKPLPLYGNGLQIRDWLYVDDHARALQMVLERGQIGSTYNVGGNSEKTNYEVVTTICELLEIMAPSSALGLKPYKDHIIYVQDRPGHDQRYAINASKIEDELGFKPEENFTTGMAKTVEWYYKQCKLGSQLSDKEHSL